MGKRMKRQTLDLPQDIIGEILADLPVKSLLRFKCVSKSWRCSISSKEFMRDHLTKSSTRTDFAHHKVILRSYVERASSLDSCSLKSVLEESSRSNLTSTNSDHHPMAKLDPSFQIARIVGTSNGLILMNLNGRGLILWNPSTRLAKYLPPASFARNPGRKNCVYGFCYDESTYDYKVVCISSESKPCTTEMYSSRTGSWSEIGKFDKGTPLYDSDKLVNARLHWLALREGCWYIVALHLVDEKYEVVARPEYLPHRDYYTPTFGNFRGDCLSLISHENWGINVWVMKRYGDAKSWTKIWTLPDFVEPRYPSLSPLWVTNNGDVAVGYGSIVFVYDGVNNKCKSQVDMVEFLHHPKIYVESLVSPFGNEERAERRSRNSERIPI